MIRIISLAIILTLLTVYANNAYAHTNLVIKDITVSAGWVEEPPLVGELNKIYLKFVKNDKPFIIEPKDLQISIKFGGITKDLELEPIGLGEYGAPIIPTRTGSYVVIIKGSIDNNPVDAEIPIEDVEDKSRLNFPPESLNTGALQSIANQLQSAISQLQLSIEQTARKSDNANKITQETLEEVRDLKAEFDKVYNFGMLGISLGAAGVIMGIIALIRKPKEY